MKNIVLCLALLALAMTAFAADHSVVTINGGRQSVVMHPMQQHNVKLHPPANPFYDDIGTTGYNCCSGWTVSDGSPINTEYTPANQFVSLKSGTTKKVSVGVGFVEGTNGGVVILDKDCKNLPCGTIDKTHLCKGNIKNLPTFGQSSSQVENIKCAAKLTKGKNYWVYVQSPANTWTAWNLTTSLGGFVEGTNDVWGSYSSGSSMAAITVK